MAALQTVALRNGQSAQSRSMAGILNNSITDAMRANVTAARSCLNNSSCTVSTATGTSLADDDINAWLGSSSAPSARAPAASWPARGGQCDITVQWVDSRTSSTSTAGGYAVTRSSYDTSPPPRRSRPERYSRPYVGRDDDRAGPRAGAGGQRLRGVHGQPGLVQDLGQPVPSCGLGAHRLRP